MDLHEIHMDGVKKQLRERGVWWFFTVCASALWWRNIALTVKGREQSLSKVERALAAQRVTARRSCDGGRTNTM